MNLKLVLYTCLAFVVFCENYGMKRQKRQLIYRDKSKIFLRLNGKVNVIPGTTILAGTMGFKMAWDVPHKSYLTKRSIFENSILDDIDIFLNRFGRSEHFCVVNYFCGVLEKDLENYGFLWQLFQYLFTAVLRNLDDNIENVLSRCMEYKEKCNHQDFMLSPYTDLY